jgi:prophage antirepressor-like protein
MLDNNPIFLASSVSYILGYKNTEELLQYLNVSQILSTTPNSPIRTINETNNLYYLAEWISESGLFIAILESNKAYSTEMSNWIVEEVLPKMRKSDVRIEEVFQIGKAATEYSRSIGLNKEESIIAGSNVAMKLTGMDLLDLMGEFTNK